jgi:hypothetical protein
MKIKWRTYFLAGCTSAVIVVLSESFRFQPFLNPKEKNKNGQIP